MDLISLLVGLLLGLIIGCSGAWLWNKSAQKGKASATQESEAELKALLAEQAKSHLHANRAAIQNIEKELKFLSNSVTKYESVLNESAQEFPSSTFFGEHASLFLRNTDNSTVKFVEKQNTQDQPKDFANAGSGVFDGSGVSETIVNGEKSNN